MEREAVVALPGKVLYGQACSRQMGQLKLDTASSAESKAILQRQSEQ